MLKNLSAKYQKEIALGFMSVFIISGVAAAKAQSIYYSQTFAPAPHYYAGSMVAPAVPSSNSAAFMPTANHVKPFVKMKAHEPVTPVMLNGTAEMKTLQPESPSIGGPGQPETSSFKSVGADNMVSTFSGDFSYNIPLLDVGGYPVNAFYSSGITMDQESSWLGLGWNINPGVVSRNMRGIPDDFDGSDKIVKKQSMRDDKTWGVTGAAGLKLAGFPELGLSASLGLSYNNKLGYATEMGIHPALSLGGKTTDSKTSALTYKASVDLTASSRNGASLTPSIGLDLEQKDGDKGTTSSLGAGFTYNSRMGITGMHLNAGVSKSQKEAKKQDEVNDPPEEGEKDDRQTHSMSCGTFSSSISYAYPTLMPSMEKVFTRSMYTLSFAAGGELFGVNGNVTISGYLAQTKIAPDDKTTVRSAYGILYEDKGEKDPSGLLDFNRLNDGPYTPSGPAIAMPLYTYDIFSLSGEGTGGSFRAYRGDIGYVHDPLVRSKDDSYSLSADVGFGNTLHGGAEFSYAVSPTEVSAWKSNNIPAAMLHFNPNDGAFQGCYFKNPGEKTIPDAAFQDAAGDDKLVRFAMINTGSGSPLLSNKLIKFDATLNRIGSSQLTADTKKSRDKRTQVISFLTAEEAGRVGFDKDIYSYNSDDTKVLYGVDCDKTGVTSIARAAGKRKPNHISEIDVLGTDGRKYVYGIPVYNNEQRDVSFSNDNGDESTGKSSYTPGVDDSELNSKGRDWYMQQDITPAYAHSFLLTELVSPNYVDITGNGITEDDMGDAVKFNYTKVDEDYKWRTPADAATASYSKGLRTDPRDDKSHYVYGTRENWMLYSIESKNMVARFYIKNDRKDCREVLGPQGGRDDTKGMVRLDKICLFSKGELKKYPNGTGAKPIKTIQFFQSYKLCKNADNNVAGYGKLTLDSIHISYNGLNKKTKSRYVFYYPADADHNPDYAYSGSDRWGTYKPPTDNPGGLLNADYPYTLQNDRSKADKYAMAWTMNKILLPSGGTINVDYESDDYAYVQNRRASDMMQVLGFGSTRTPNLSDPGRNRLYNGSSDNDYVYVSLPSALDGTDDPKKQQDLAARYLAGMSQLYMKLAVVMPSGGNVSGIAGYENIPVYADIAEYGFVNPSVAWIRVARVQGEDGMVSPMVQQALQFMKQQLPGKAFSGYDNVDENGSNKSIMIALAGMISSLGELLIGTESKFRSDNKCSTTELNKCFVRLDDPYLKKIGGGLRVKKIVISDNWDKMTNQYRSTYGQEYKYIKNEIVNNKNIEISSGVASWEPAIGGDENPFKEIMRFMNHNKGGPYDFGAVDMPLGEALYPSASVGYSRVEVLSIHRDTVKNLPTRQVTEYYTTKDFPFKSSCTPLSDGDANVQYAPSAINQLLHLDMQKQVTQSQGFLVELNDMNGRQRLQATYAANDPNNPVAYTQNYYNIVKATDNTYSFNHQFRTIADAHGAVGTSLLGRDVELMADFRQHTAQTITTNISPNLDFFFVGIFPIPLTNLLSPVVSEGTMYRSASLLKVVNHYAMIDSVVTVDKGSKVSTENLIYDAESGNVLLTKTQNEHNKPIYNFSYPAHWAYSGMGGAYKNIDAVFSGIYTFRHGKMVNMPSNMDALLESGDELYMIVENNTLSPNMPCDNNVGDDPWSTLQPTNVRKIWAVNTSKVASITPQWVFMDEKGNPVNATTLSTQKMYLRVIRSGHRNMLDQMAGSIVSMSNPVIGNQLVFNDNTNIIQTSAATFKDHWRVDNSFDLKDSLVKIQTPLPLKRRDFYPVAALKILRYHPHGNSSHFSANGDNTYFMAGQQSYGGQYSKSKHFITSYAAFDFNAIPTDAVIVTAKMTLTAHSDPNAPGNFIQGHNLPPYPNDLTGVPDMLTHTNAFPHNHSGTDNSFKISRVTVPWGANPYSDAWWNLYSGPTAFKDPEGVSAAFNPADNQSYLFQDGCHDGRLDVTKMVSKMLHERSLPYIFRLELINNNNYIEDWTTPPAKVCFYPPSASVYYYSCSESTGTGSGGELVCNSTTLQRTEDNVSSSTPPPSQGTFYCTTYEHHYFCLSKFTQMKSVNPYTEGILGNWRVDSTYAYFGERKEQSVATPVDTRTGGTILNYQSFWNLLPGGQPSGYLSRNFAANNVWVWNSAITQYNRKGYETENTDPLGRFNSGLYGYNQQLPVAVANNSRLREILFDGFEDYDYSTSQNCISCKPHHYYHFATDITSSINASEHHTGIRSLQVAAGTNLDITAPVVTQQVADNGYELRIKVDSTYTLMGNNGMGLKAEYYNQLGFFGTPVAVTANTSPTFSWPSNAIPIPGLNSGNISIKWSGKILMPYTGNYKFRATAFNHVKIFVNNAQVLNTDFGSPVSYTSGNFYSAAGQTWDITIEYQKNSNSGSNPGNTIEWNLNDGAMSAIPNNYLFSPTNTYQVTNTACIRLDSLNIRGAGLTDTFSLIAGRKMLVGAWVKEGGTDCKCVTYTHNNITVSFTGSSQTYTAAPAGSIIEGWQRYETVIDIPANATAIKLRMANTGNQPVYFDDIRVQPFNSNMKTFVYHPSNLRLTSELDENNYATFYEYDDDGTLTRVKKETREGIKTITETRSALQQAVQP